jgi:hypothetical protein
MKSCDAESFIILFLSLFLFGASFSGSLWNLLVIGIVCAAIWVLIYNFQGKNYLQQKVPDLALLNFKQAAKGSTVIIVFSWIIVLVNIGFLIYAFVSKDDFLRMLRKEDVNKNKANDVYTLVITMTTLAIVMMVLFLILSYKSRSCFLKVMKVNNELTSQLGSTE